MKLLSYNTAGLKFQRTKYQLRKSLSKYHWAITFLDEYCEFNIFIHCIPK